MAGYSEKSLRDKLGLKPGFSAVFLYAPFSHLVDLGDVDDLEIFPMVRSGHDFIHLFVREQSVLVLELPKLKEAIKSNGMIWVSWPKKASKVPTDVDENFVREFGISNGMVDVKVAAIDDIWSALKFVIPVKDR